MTVLFSPTTIRALFLAAVLAAAAALTAASARGSPVLSAELKVLSAVPILAQPSALGPQYLVFAEEWSWAEFVKYWQRQAGSMSGVVGTVVLVAGLAVLIIISKGKT
jgi:hypothetical protein